MFAHHRGKYSKVKLCYNKIFKGFLKYVISALKKNKKQTPSLLKDACHSYDIKFIPHF